MRISDWSSDVCSSDLGKVEKSAQFSAALVRFRFRRTGRQARQRNFAQLNTLHVDRAVQQPPGSPADLNGRDRKPRALVIADDEIGRASWREGVCQYG